jgi:hypothetical protein
MDLFSSPYSFGVWPGGAGSEHPIVAMPSCAAVTPQPNNCLGNFFEREEKDLRMKIS